MSHKLTKQYVLSKVSQITIFSTYLNLTNTVIQNCIDRAELICSPLREDVHPTCGFRYDAKGKLKFRDFSGYFWGDCFDVVAFVMSSLYNKSYDVSNKEDFVKVLRHITFTFKDVFYGGERDVTLINEINSSVANIKRTKPNIEIVVRKWTKEDANYWSSFGVSLQWLNVNLVYPIDQFYINRKVNPEPKYFHNVDDPCYAYVLGRDRNGIYSIKLYFPKRKHGNVRFITNCNHLEGIAGLSGKEYDIIVITKSTKDRLSLGEAVNRMKPLYGGVRLSIGVINIPHETYKLRQNEYDWMDSKLSKDGTIVSLMDNDAVGKREAIWLKRNYGIIPIIIDKQYNAKDFAEFVSVNDKATVHDAITNTITYIKNYDRENNKSTWDSSEWSSSLPY